ncbi:hypothetical protein UT300012_22530 [Paraclostridium bifermentans]
MRNIFRRNKFVLPVEDMEAMDYLILTLPNIVTAIMGFALLYSILGSVKYSLGLPEIILWVIVIIFIRIIGCSISDYILNKKYSK